jgi:hypothetical protein
MKGNRVKSLEQSSNPLESDDVQVQGNTVSECGTGIAVEAWGWLESSGSYNKIVKNNIIDCAYGISIAAYDLGGIHQWMHVRLIIK